MLIMVAIRKGIDFVLGTCVYSAGPVKILRLIKTLKVKLLHYTGGGADVDGGIIGL